jgi:hypothetical protein
VVWVIVVAMTEYGMCEPVVAVGLRLLRRVTVATTVAEVDKVVGETCDMFDDTVVLAAAAAVGVDAEVHVLHGHMIP